ncbi:MAG TPA: hypothetical protein VGJ76_14500, partial [Pseudolabrys sp.]
LTLALTPRHRRRGHNKAGTARQYASKALSLSLCAKDGLAINGWALQAMWVQAEYFRRFG